MPAQKGKTPARRGDQPIPGREREAKERLCITCRKPFFSQHSGVRMCVYCRTTKEDDPGAV